MGCSEQRERDTIFSYRHQYQMVSFIRSKNLSAVEELFRKGFKADFRMTSFYGRTPLHVAVAENVRGICDVILRQEKVQVDAKDDNGMTPLMLAVDREQREIVKLLLDQDPKPRLDIYNRYGKTVKDYIHSPLMKKIIEESEWDLYR